MPTIGFSNKVNQWTSRYSYGSSDFSRVRNKFMSSPSSPLTNANHESPVWLHNSGDEYNKFYGLSVPSSLVVSFNEKSSNNKIFKTFSVEGSGNLSGSTSIMKTNNHIDVRNNSNPNQAVSIDFLRTINGTTYGPIASERGLFPGKNVINLGLVTRVRYIPDFSGVPAHYRVHLDNTTGISPQVYQAPRFQMKMCILVVDQTNPQGTRYLFSNGQTVGVTQMVNQTYSTISAFTQDAAVFNDGSLPDSFVAFNPQLNTFNYTAPNGALKELIDYHTDQPATDVYLIGIAHPSLVGEPARGKFAEASIQVPVSKGYFEISSLNLQYDTIQLAHDK